MEFLAWALLALVLLIVVDIILFDAIALARGTPTLSLRIWTLCQREPIVPMAAGLVIGTLLGHLAWRIQH